MVRRTRSRRHFMVDEFGRLNHIQAAFALNKTLKSVDVPINGFFMSIPVINSSICFAVSLYISRTRCV
jgi:hypothetical protein